MSAFGMELQSLLSLVGGTAGLLCLIYFLLSKKRKVRLEGKVVLVTGANSGLGKGIDKYPVLVDCSKTVLYN